MIVDAGFVALPIALLVCVYVSVASLIVAWQRLPSLVLSARYGLMAVPILLLI